MTRVTFGVSSLSSIANMCVDHASEFPLASKAVEDAFYVDDGVTGADSQSSCATNCKLYFGKAGLLL